MRVLQGAWRRMRPAAVLLALSLGFAALSFAPRLQAQEAFAGGWTLNAENSTIAFQSVKNETVVESSTFATYTGSISPQGQVELVVQLDSVDTKIDLRNVRMRFLFFETFTFPVARVSAQLDVAALADLPSLRRKVVPLVFTLDLHGVKKELAAQAAVVMITPDLVSVSSLAPVSVGVDDFGLMPGLQKLQEAANVKILPSGSVTFDLLFARNSGAAAPAAPSGPAVVAAAPGTAGAGTAPAVAEPPVTPGAAAALETKGDFSAEECSGRFEILSRSRSITFRTGSARLDPLSNDFLNALYDIVSRCPGMVIEVGGHTDSDGSGPANQQLSERRAAAVAEYLVSMGAQSARLVPRGYGEEAPVAANDSAEGKARNRRIEFKVIG